MDKGRCAFSRLYQIRLHGVQQKGEDGSCHSEILHTERRVVETVAEQDVVYPSSHVLYACRQAEDSHYFRSRGDVEARLCREAVCARAKSGDYASERAVIDIEDAFPQNLLQCETFSLMLIDVVVQKG